MFGEYLASNDPNLQQPGVRHYEGCWMIGSFGTLAGLQPSSLPVYSPGSTPDREPPWYCFSSRHSAGVQFCYGDGHVGTIKRGQTFVGIGTALAAPDWQILQQLAGRSDGKTADPSPILD